jgi:hypothetical protein
MRIGASHAAPAAPAAICCLTCSTTCRLLRSASIFTARSRFASSGVSSAGRNSGYLRSHAGHWTRVPFEQPALPRGEVEQPDAAIASRRGDPTAIGRPRDAVELRGPPGENLPDFEARRQLRALGPCPSPSTPSRRLPAPARHASLRLLIRDAYRADDTRFDRIPARNQLPFTRPRQESSQPTQPLAARGRLRAFLHPLQWR